MKDYYSSGIFAKKAKVTLRTIRYYDKIGLLKPTYVDDIGRRFYTDDDFTKLQQILSFKVLGFSLDEIKTMVSSSPSKAMLERNLSLQLSFVRKRKEQLEQMEQSLLDATDFLQKHDDVDLDHMVHLIHLSSFEQSLKDQYKTAQNIDARIALHKAYSHNQEGWFPFLFKSANLLPDMNVLEVGCGTGAFWMENVSSIPNHCSLTLTDISKGLLDETETAFSPIKESLEKLKHTNVTFKACDATELPFKDNSFDLVVGNHLFFYIEDRVQAYQEIKRVLKPGGTFIASTYGPKHMREITTLVQEFNPAIVLADQKLYDVFGLHNGHIELGDYFTEIACHTYDDYLDVTDYELLLEYIISCHGNQNEYILPKFQEFKDMLAKKLHYKPFHITKDAGVFICKK
ncbi:MAG: methyltransferase domain-containing protein [Lachnospiraceae bacterium]